MTSLSLLLPRLKKPKDATSSMQNLGIRKRREGCRDDPHIYNNIMPFPFYRVAAAWIRAFARPVLNYAKKYHQSKYDDINQTFKNVLIFFGNASQKFENIFNRRFYHMDAAILARGLNREIALEKGIQYFYEMLIYVCILGFSLYEIYKSEWEAEERIVDMEAKIQDFKVRHAYLQEVAVKMSEQLGKASKGFKHQRTILQQKILHQSMEKNKFDIMFEDEVKAVTEYEAGLHYFDKAIGYFERSPKPYRLQLLV